LLQSVVQTGGMLVDLRLAWINRLSFSSGESFVTLAYYYVDLISDMSSLERLPLRFFMLVKLSQGNIPVMWYITSGITQLENR